MKMSIEIILLWGSFFLFTYCKSFVIITNHGLRKPLTSMILSSSWSTNNNNYNFDTSYDYDPLYSQEGTSDDGKKKKRGVGREGYNITFLEKNCDDNVTLYHEIYQEFSWNEIYLKALKEYSTEHGHVNVPYRCVYHDITLGRWLTLVRTRYRSGRLSPTWIEKFNQLGIDWNPPRKQLSKKKNSDKTKLQPSSNNALELLPTRPITISGSVDALTRKHSFSATNSLNDVDDDLEDYKNKRMNARLHNYDSKCWILLQRHFDWCQTQADSNHTFSQKMKNDACIYTYFSYSSLCEHYTKSISAQLYLWIQYTLPGFLSKHKSDHLCDPEMQHQLQLSSLISPASQEGLLNDYEDSCNFQQCSQYYILELKYFQQQFGKDAYVPLAYPHSNLGKFIYYIRKKYREHKYQQKQKLDEEYIPNNNDNEESSILFTEVIEQLRDMGIDLECNDIIFQQKAFSVLTLIRNKEEKSESSSLYNKYQSTNELQYQNYLFQQQQIIQNKSDT